MFYLNGEEKKRLKDAIRAVFSIPFVDDIEDYIWEAIFSYTKGMEFVDPLTNIRSKRLFDVVDAKHGIGWSIKAAQKTVNLPCDYEVVIQRADIFKKAKELGYGRLSLNSDPQTLGSALMKHWYEEKVKKDAESQGVIHKRVCILLKSHDRRTYAYFEDSLAEYRAKDLDWNWTDKTKTGLQAKRKKDDQLVFRWYPNQKQFFERFTFPLETYKFSIEPARLAARDVVELLLARLEGRL
ncbi:MAG: hypothetical protein IT314_14870 [Anaerolineales bacterium]|nr:hypothetical protein [Anaerolineales bacterium]